MLFFESPAFKKAYLDFIKRNGYNGSSQCIFEPKATGITMVQDLKTMKLDEHSINVIEGTPPKDSKQARLIGVSSIIESGRVYLLKGASWVEAFLDECKMFPNGSRDDQVDCLSGILERELLNILEPNFRTL